MKAYGEFGRRGFSEWVVRNKATWKRIKRNRKRSLRKALLGRS